MKISSISSLEIPFFKNISSLLNTTNKKITAIALCIFGLLGGICLIACCFFKGNNPKKAIYTNGEMKHADGTWSKGRYLNGELIEGILYFPSGAISEGTFSNYQLYGEGTYTNADKVVYKGPFKGNMLDGENGKILLPNGSVYKEGTFKGDKLFGKGIHYSGKTIYKGNFFDDRMYEGKIIFSNGDFHEGTFNKEGELEGKECVIQHLSGYRQKGPFIKGKMVGKGEMILDNRVYKGTFVEGMLEGEAIVTDKEGNLIAKGNFHENLFRGEGSWDENEIVRSGNFDGGKLNGKGKRIDHGLECEWEGTFKDDVFVKGVKKTNKSTEEGDFILVTIRGRPQEKLKKGTIYIKEGNMKYEGNFYDGNVTSIYPDGRTYTSKYKNFRSIS